MSIITEALKKAQEDRLKKRSRIDTEIGQPYVESAPETEKRTARNTGKEPAASKIPVVYLVVFSAVVLTGGLIAALLYITHSNVKPPSIDKPPVDKHLTITHISSKEKALPEEEISVPKKKEVTEIFTDFVDKKTEKEKISLPHLNGIMYSPDNPQAVINGVMVSEGEVIDGCTIMKILPNKVRITAEGEEFELELR